MRLLREQTRESLDLAGGCWRYPSGVSQSPRPPGNANERDGRTSQRQATRLACKVQFTRPSFCRACKEDWEGGRGGGAHVSPAYCDFAFSPWVSFSDTFISRHRKGCACMPCFSRRVAVDTRVSSLAGAMFNNVLILLSSTILDRCGDMVAILISRPLAAAFVRPVDHAQVPGYADVVSKPMDLVSISTFIATNSSTIRSHFVIEKLALWLCGLREILAPLLHLATSL